MIGSIAPEAKLSARAELKLDAWARASLCCPICQSGFDEHSAELVCANSTCKAAFPIVDGVPILINEAQSVFSIEDVVRNYQSGPDTDESGLPTRVFRRVANSISNNLKAEENYKRFSDVLFERNNSPRVLVIGGRTMGQGMEVLTSDRRVRVVETDVMFGPRTKLICDSHSLPFRDRSFDGVVVQAVLQLVADPYRCSDEIHRVLVNDGLVYAETSFMQPVQERGYDFTRFTHIGLRRLFRMFSEVDSGVMCGPGMALGWTYLSFLLSFATSRAMRRLAYFFAGLTAFHLKYFDRYLINKPGAFDGASGYYFLGAKAETPLSDRELVKLYKGAT